MGLEWPGLHEWQAALKSIEANVDKASLAALTEIAALGERTAKGNFEGQHKKGQPHVGGPKPNVVTGNLRRSIQKSSVIRQGPGWYEQNLFPTAIYSRAVELGNPRVNSRAYPYFGPAMRTLRLSAQEILTKHWSKYI